MRLEELRSRYRGRRAREYDQDRASQEEWQREDRAVAQLLTSIDLGAESMVLDIPVGTGRFLPLFRSLGCEVIGLDVSPDMLEQAATRAKELGLERAEIREGDITAIDLEDASVDVSVVIRIANMLDPPDLRRAFKELDRVTRHHLVIGLQLRRYNSWKGWLQMIRDRRKDQATRPHSESFIEGIFRRLRLEIVEQVLVRESKLTPYYIYLLKRTS